MVRSSPPSSNHSVTNVIHTHGRDRRSPFPMDSHVFYRDDRKRNTEKKSWNVTSGECPTAFRFRTNVRNNVRNNIKTSRLSDGSKATRRKTSRVKVRVDFTFKLLTFLKKNVSENFFPGFFSK